MYPAVLLMFFISAAVILLDMTKVISVFYNFRKTPNKTLYNFIVHKL